MSSPIFSEAAATWREIHNEWHDVVEAAFLRAEQACRGTLLNRRGRERGIDARSLFYGPAVRAYAYASPELIEHWQSWPRVPFHEYERQALNRAEVACEHCGEQVWA